MKKWIIYNKGTFLCIIAFLCIIFYSFYANINKYYGYSYDKTIELYERDFEQCKLGSNEDYNKEYCDNLTYPKTPLEEFKLLDAKTLFFKVWYEHGLEAIYMFLPLFVMMLFVFIIHKDFSCGMIRNILMRESLKKYKRKVNKKILLISLIVPLFIFLYYIISCILTRFNFNVDSSFVTISVYNKWNYDHMFLYLIISYITTFFLCIYYCNIACCFINKNKNPFIILIISYVCWFIIVFLVAYLQPLITPPNHFINKYFNLLDYWHYYDELSKCWYGYIVSAGILALVSFLVKEIILRNKEKVIIENEKGII